MIFGIDFDGTITKRPNILSHLCEELFYNGDKIIVISNRNENYTNRQIVEDFLANYDYEKYVSAVLLTSGIPKREYARKHNFEVDIWIDDNPVLVDFGMQGYDDLHKRDPSAIKG